MNERRKARRITFETSALVQVDGSEPFAAEVETENISLKGLFLKTDKLIPVNTDCSVEIGLQGTTSNMRFTVEGKICRHDPSGLGIAFTRLNVDNYTHISNLVNLQASQKQE